jgi:hypothetical protein
MVMTGRFRFARKEIRLGSREVCAAPRSSIKLRSRPGGETRLGGFFSFPEGSLERMPLTGSDSAAYPASSLASSRLPTGCDGANGRRQNRLAP